MQTFGCMTCSFNFSIQKKLQTETLLPETSNKNRDNYQMFTESCLYYPKAMYGILPYIWLISMAHVAENTMHGSYGIENNMYTKPHMIYEQKGPQRVFEQNPTCLNKIPNVLVSGHGLLFLFWANYYNSKTCLIRACWGKIIPLQSPPIY